MVYDASAMFKWVLPKHRTASSKCYAIFVVKDPKNINVDGNLQVYHFWRIPFRISYQVPYYYGGYHFIPFEANWYPTAKILKQDIIVMTGAKTLHEATQEFLQ